MPDVEQLEVRYSVKELLLEIRKDIRELSGRLDTKADIMELAAIDKRVTAAETRVDTLEDRAATQDALEKYKKWLLVSVGIGGLSAISQVAPYVPVILKAFNGH